MSLRVTYARVLLIVLSAAIAMGLVSGLALAQSTADWVRQTGILKVGLDGTYPPFNFVDENGMMAGFDVDISKEIARRLGVKVEFIGTLWTSLIPELQADTFDVIIAQMSITEERQQSVDFTVPYVTSGTVLVARTGDDRFSELSDLAGFKVGVGEGTTFETIARGVDGALVQAYDDFAAYSQELLAGTIDVIIDDQLTAAYNINEQGLPLQITSAVLSEERLAIAVRKGNQDFVAQLNSILNEMKADGTYRTIYVKWFGAGPTF